jgi:predicted kinase
MKNKKQFIFLSGIQGSGKTTYAKKIINEQPDIMYINLDDIHKKLHGEHSGGADGDDKAEATRLIMQATKNNNNILFDATNSKYTKRNHFISMVKPKGYTIKIIYFNIPLQTAFENNLKRKENGGHYVNYNTIKDIFLWGNFPLISEASEIVIFNLEKENKDASRIFKDSLSLLRKNPYEWIIQYESFIKTFIPELEITKGFMQYNRHTLDVFSHSIKTTYNVSQKTDNELLLLAALLHDLGKFHTRKFITRYNEDTYQVVNAEDCFINKTTNIVKIRPFSGGNKEIINVDIKDIQEIRGTFFGHENVSSKLAYDICIRLGYNEQDSLYIANLTQLHMDMPVYTEDKDDNKSVQRWKNFREKCKHFINDLVILREADANGK